MKNCGAGIAVGQGSGRGGMGGTPGAIKALVAVMTVCDWVVAGSCGGISWAAVLAMVVCDCAAAGSCGRISWACRKV